MFPLSSIKSCMKKYVASEINRSGTRHNYGNMTYNVLEKQQQWDLHLFFRNLRNENKPEEGKRKKIHRRKVSTSTSSLGLDAFCSHEV